MSGGTLLQAAITWPSSFAISDQLGSQDQRRLPIRQASAEPGRSDAQQMVADGSGNHIGGRTATSTVNRPAVERCCAIMLHRGSSHLPRGASCRSRRVQTASTSVIDNVSTHSQNPDVETRPSMVTGIANR